MCCYGVFLFVVCCSLCLLSAAICTAGVWCLPACSLSNAVTNTHAGCCLPAVAVITLKAAISRAFLTFPLSEADKELTKVQCKTVFRGDAGKHSTPRVFAVPIISASP